MRPEALATIRRVAAFELRYQMRSPVFVGATALLFLGAFANMAVVRLLSVGGGNVFSNSSHALILSHLLMSLLLLFIGAVFVSDAVLRDDQSGFAPLIRVTGLSPRCYLLGRFLAASLLGSLVIAAGSLGNWLGTLMPFADQSLLGPNRVSGFMLAYGLFALPNLLIITAVLFALVITVRSTAATFVGVIMLLIAYLVGQRLMEAQPDLQSWRVLADPLGMSAYLAASRYLTAVELNAGKVSISDLMIISRLLWIGLALALLAATCARFTFREVGPSRRRIRLRKKISGDREAPVAKPSLRLPRPRFRAGTTLRQVAARASLEARFVLRSPLFLILIPIVFTLAMIGVAGASTFLGTPLYPQTYIAIPIIAGSFRPLIVVIAAFYAGELVWRERERGVDAILDAAPLPAWTLMLPKFMGLAFVLIATLAAGMGAGAVAQALHGGVVPDVGEYLGWYLLPGAGDAIITAALAVFVQTLSPSKYVGWGVMTLYLLLLTFGPSLGLSHPLLIYGHVPATELSDMNGAGNFARPAWLVRGFWAAVAVLLMLASYLRWPRGHRTPGTTTTRLSAGPLAMVLAASVAALLSGGWIVRQTLSAGAYRTAGAQQRHLADYERRYLRYARLLQPSIAHIALQVALFPAARRVETSGRLLLRNDGKMPIRDVHIRLANDRLQLRSASMPGAALVHDEPAFGYRIYRLHAAMLPGETRVLSFRTHRAVAGMPATGPDISVNANGSDLDLFDLAPMIGMSDAGLIDDPSIRARLRLPPQRPLPRLEDVAVTLVPSPDNSWATTDVTVSTSADQLVIVPGRKVAEAIRGDRRIARFVSNVPVHADISLQSARYAVARTRHGGIDLAIYHDPRHRWNVARMMRAMQASVDYYRDAFGPYQFDRAAIVETPAYREGGHAYPGTIAIGEAAAFGMDVRNDRDIDMVSLFAAHELSHQWWGHQVRGARMQGAGFLIESLAQYSALMVMERLHGPDGVQRFLAYQRDRYLGGRRAQAVEEQSLARVELSQGDIAYGKGALALYALRQEMGEAAVNRALRSFLSRYRFSTPPYPRSLDLIALLRAQARGEAQQTLISDLLERVTLWELKAAEARVARRRDGRWDVFVDVSLAKSYGAGSTSRSVSAFRERIQVGVFATAPDDAGIFNRSSAIMIEQRWLKPGRQLVHLVVASKPAYVAIDPFGLRIDRDTTDNAVKVTGDEA